jgi:hypothetical protein
MALGQEQNSGEINYPGTYRDNASGAELTVTMEAGADALARLGWVRLEDAEPNQTKVPEKKADTKPNASGVKMKSVK